MRSKIGASVFKNFSKIAQKSFSKNVFHFGKAVPQYTQLLLNNEWVDSQSGETFTTENPATEKVIATVQQSNSADVDLAVKYANEAFDNGPWRHMSGYERGQLMFKLADLMERDQHILADLETQDNGKPLHISLNVDVALSIKTYRYYAGWADKIHGETIPISSNNHCYTKREPVGVVGQIIPWNFPLAMQAWKWGPALASGCCSILKPAEWTSLTALHVGALAVEAGFPKGVVQILPGFGDVGSALSKHSGVDKVAFTGSTATGYDIMRNSHVNNLKRITLELGGKSPNIICHDADIDMAVEQSHLALFLNQGQCCCAGSRLFVHEDIYDEFVEKAVAFAKETTTVGDPFDENTYQGPQVSKQQFDKVLGYIDSGIEEGATLMMGGKRHGNKGYFIQPTIFANVQDDMKIAREEIFGPVMQILKFSDYDEVIARANDTNYGLAAGIVTKDIETYQKLANSIRAGTVYVNCYDVFDTNTPFGGFKDSGIGRELGPHGLDNYLENKTIIVAKAEGSL